ncbi:MAG TPA: HNH endonuclease [Tepidisphaeraceae bacterium]|nr:HNH endonuclease [Tepidisphaeraceae bacterium]
MQLLESSNYHEQKPKRNPIRVPQARVLRALLPKNRNEDGPVLTKAELAQYIGFSDISGTINRALYGISGGSSSGNPNRGLLDRGLVHRAEAGSGEGFQITPQGLKAIQEYGELPNLRNREICINHRYLFEGSGDAKAIEKDLHQIEQRADLTPTTKKVLTDARLGQGKFRSRVLEMWKAKCAVTGSKTYSAIRASHIIPWRKSSDEQRLDPNNGLPLIATLDALFDAGLISFDPCSKLLVSPRLRVAERKLCGVTGRSLVGEPNAQMKIYLSAHRLTHGFK